MTNQAKEVRALLIQKGITQKKIAEMANVKQPCVSSIINGRARSYKVESIITELTGYQFPNFDRVPRALANN